MGQNLTLSAKLTHFSFKMILQIFFPMTDIWLVDMETLAAGKIQI